MSVFLGETLTEVLERLASGQAPEAKIREINLDLARVPVIARDNTDRNRTSPFAFTGNKFEFRALGASQSISYPITFLNAAVAHTLKEMNALLKSKTGGKRASNNQILEVVNEIYAATKSVCFEGDGYSAEWHAEAARRGLPNLKSTPEALIVLLDEKNRSMLVEQGIFNAPDEVEARYNVLIEQYNLRRMIELQVQEDLVSSQIIPALMLHITMVAKTLEGADELLGKVSATQRKHFETLNGFLDTVISLRDKLSGLIAKANDLTDQAALGHFLAKDGSETMKEIYRICGEVELHVDDDLWSLPKYRELIYSL
jgi:glutamine synthetase